MNPDLLSPKPQDCAITRSTLASSPAIHPSKEPLQQCHLRTSWAEALCLCEGLHKHNRSISGSSITDEHMPTDCPDLGEYGCVSESSLCARPPPFFRHLAAAQEDQRRCSSSSRSESCHNPKLQATTAQGNTIPLW